MAQSFDTVVIGSGPGGYVAAIRAAQLGQKTAIIEKESLGGVCLNVGCIPSKALITASHFFHRLSHDAATMGIKVSAPELDTAQLQKWKSSVTQKMSQGVGGLLKGNKVSIISGEASFHSKTEIKVGSEIIGFKNCIIATGSRPIQIPGFEFDEKNILSSTGALAMNETPQSVAIVGGGYIGLEIGGFLKKFGSQVYILEAADSLLAGVIDPDCSQVVYKKLKSIGIEFLMNTKAESQKKLGSKIEVTLSNGTKIVVDKLIVTVGRKPNSDQLNLKSIGIEIDERGFIKTNSQRKTNIPNIYAVGDIAGQPMLAHKASHEGILVAEVIAGHNRAYDVKTVPAVVFTDPEMASAGLLEAEALKKYGAKLKIGKFPFAANGRAVSMIETDGFVKILAEPEHNRVVGVHMVGPEVSNLISEAALAIEMGATLDDLARTIHPHPTLGETMMETAEAALGHAIHVIQRTK